MKKLLYVLFFLPVSMYCMENNSDRLSLNTKTKTLWMALYLNSNQCSSQHRSNIVCKSFYNDMLEMLNKCETKIDSTDFYENSTNKYLNDLKTLKGIEEIKISVPFEQGVSPDCMKFWRDQMAKHVTRCTQGNYLIRGDLCVTHESFKWNFAGDYERLPTFYNLKFKRKNN